MRKLDLHDLTLKEAYDEFNEFINKAYSDNISKVSSRCICYPIPNIRITSCNSK